ncbi:MAG: hypothetical protein DWB42_21460, partial [Chloroflexi bacterium]|nr:hypothetical protein [Chloroflexota bacterium]MDL1885928.1 hypothetical protein [Anaerolineae bacterium CFX8]
MSPADNTPNFDAMTPEEIMAWMESLAKRQGANEGFTTSADMEIAEIDPSSVQIDEPGYVPYGKDPQKWAEEEAARKAAAASRPIPAVPPAEPSRPAAEVAPPQPEMPPPPAKPEELPVAPSAMSWLESLAVDSGLPDLDLSGLGAEITPITPAEIEVPANPIDWLESLAQGQEEETQTTEPVATAADPFAGGVDPMSWLESLARQQGARHEEMTTEANLDVPPPEHISQIEGPGYTPYSFDTLGLSERPPEESLPAQPATEAELRLEPTELEDPSAWLDSLASSQGFTPEAPRGAKAERPMSDDEIQAALERGEQIPPDQMERWMSRQLEFGAARDEPVEAYDPDAPAVPAELPDWLIEQVGAAPPEDLIAPQPPLIEKITEPPQAADIPDWLKEEAPAGSDLDNIFAVTGEEFPAAPAVPESTEEAPDPWAEALEYERQHDVSEVPDWYARNITDPDRIAAVNS